MLVPTNCDDCANCCRWFFKSQRPRIFEDEIDRIEKATGKKREEFTEKHKEDTILKFNDKFWCPFIDKQGKGGKCSIWEIKPAECSLYPVFCFSENGKVIGLDLNCPRMRENFEVDLKEIANKESLFRGKRPCLHFSRAILLKT